MIDKGCIAEFADEQALAAAIGALRARGYTRLDAFTPYPVEGLAELLGLPRSDLARWVFPFAAFGGLAGYLVQWWVEARAYPLDVGGRPLVPWPAYVPITFESTILVGGIAAFVLALALNRYPEPSNPIFEVEGFERSSVDRFFLAVDARDPIFAPGRAIADLEATQPLRVTRFGAEEEP